jgi:hypothetical protein
MHHLTLHITTTQNADKLFSGIHSVLQGKNYGVIFWSTTEGENTQMGLVVRKETKANAMQEIENHLLKNGINDYKFIHPIRRQVSSLWLQWYMPKEYNLRFA